MAPKIFEISLRELKDVNERFQSATGIDEKNVPGKYGDAVKTARWKVEQLGYARGVYEIFHINQKEAGEVLLRGGWSLCGEVVPRFLKNAEKGICFVATIPGFDKLEEEADEMMEKYFIDSWGSAFIQASEVWCRKYFEGQISEEERLTPVWSPGQYHFNLSNQKTLFSILKPECIVVHLNEYCKMDPIKSVSGVCGIVSKDEKEDLRPCLFCSIGRKCPSFMKGCG